jgi:hypothetical protein
LGTEGVSEKIRLYCCAIVQKFEHLSGGKLLNDPNFQDPFYAKPIVIYSIMQLGVRWRLDEIYYAR